MTYTSENLGGVNRNGISLPKPAASIPLLHSNSSLDSGNLSLCLGDVRFLQTHHKNRFQTTVRICKKESDLEVCLSTTDEKSMLTYTDENPENLSRVNRNGISLPKPAASIPLLQSNSSLDSGN
ncbi:hypothetical protein CDAR_307231 [Caerostris darwini]|uniref:Uncharacterized protein n=1 Tax=Caerostris darwini TaxID=1538125 RepID=A0AAV4WX70_9ARAC|nr:hypothetical protein CDAR_307231 [Caerostris darwini]